MSDFNLARLKKGSEVFEIVVDPDRAINCKGRAEVDVRDVLLYPKIYSDAKKGLLASEQRLQALFNTTDPIQIARQIIDKGDIQVTSEHRKAVQDQKRKRIIDIIHKQGVDPRTNAPHPLTRVENAFDQAKVRIDDNKPPEQQVPEIIKAMRPILPIKLVTKELSVIIPAQYASRAIPILKQFGKILKDNWGNDGSWQGRVEIPGGLETDFYDKLNSLTHGDVQATLISTKGETQ